MKISIVVPVYKVENYLRQCIESVINQTYKDIEIILVDDGSPDNCPAICDEYALKDNRISVIHKLNEGVSIARQIGVEIAQGEYVCFVDSDDWLELNAIERLAEPLKKQKTDVICAGYYRVNGANRNKHCLQYNAGIYDYDKIKSDIYPFLIENEKARYFSPSLWGKLFRTSLYKNNQVRNVKIIMGEDGACVKACIYNAKSMAIILDCVYNYRIVESSITCSGKPLLWNGPQLIFEHLREHIDLKQYDFYDQAYRNTVHNLFNVAMSQFYRSEPYKAISKDIKRNISSKCYVVPIKKCHFSGTIQGKIAEISLRYKIIWLIYLCWRYKNR